MDAADEMSDGERDALAMLYDEDLAGEPTAAARETVEGWRRVRDLVSHARTHGFDEEPPARLDAMLLAAAKQHRPAPRPGLMERLRRWLAATMLQPAVAGATALVVIGGTAGVLYMRGQGGATEPRISHTASGTTEPTTRPPTFEAPAGGEVAALEQHKDLSLFPPEPAPDPATGQQQGLSTASTPELKPDPNLESTRDRWKVGQEDGAARAGTGGGDVGTKGGAGDDTFAGNADRTLSDPQPGTVYDYRVTGREATTVVKTGEASGAGGGAGGDGAVGRASGSGGTAIAGVTTRIDGAGAVAPPPPDTGDDAATLDDEAERRVTQSEAVQVTASNRRVEKARPSKRAQAENLLKQARTAARKKDCNTVKVMAKRARSLDAAYYTNTFARDAVVKDCL